MVPKLYVETRQQLKSIVMESLTLNEDAGDIAARIVDGLAKFLVFLQEKLVKLLGAVYGAIIKLKRGFFKTLKAVSHKRTREVVFAGSYKFVWAGNTIPTIEDFKKTGILDLRDDSSHEKIKAVYDKIQALKADEAREDFKVKYNFEAAQKLFEGSERMISELKKNTSKLGKGLEQDISSLKRKKDSMNSDDLKEYMSRKKEREMLAKVYVEFALTIRKATNDTGYAQSKTLTKSHDKKFDKRAEEE